VTGADGASIYIVDWAQDAAHLIYPPATTAGLDVTDKPEQSVRDDDGNDFLADCSLYDWFVGLAVEDPRHIARLCNIDTSDALVDAPTQGKMIDKLDLIMAHMPEPGAATRVLYVTKKIYAAFSKQARSYNNLALSIEDYLGKKVPHFNGYPIRKMDQQSSTEPTVTLSL
jgi:hypothetical protein